MTTRPTIDEGLRAANITATSTRLLVPEPKPGDWWETRIGHCGWSRVDGDFDIGGLDPGKEQVVLYRLANLNGTGIIREVRWRTLGEAETRYLDEEEVER